MIEIDEATTIASGPNLIDTDVHEVAQLEDLLPYLSAIWHKYITDYGWQPEERLPYAQPTAGGLDRADAKPGDGRPGGSDLGLLREQVLDLYDVGAAILTGWLNVSSTQERTRRRTSTRYVLLLQLRLVGAELADLTFAFGLRPLPPAPQPSSSIGA